ncbi:pre-mRNA-processing-splicing factor 8, partial [Kipferlia bialata]|eukprot:g14414.t1
MYLTLREPNEFCRFPTTEIESKHPLRLYLRIKDDVYTVWKFRPQDSEGLVRRFLAANPDPSNTHAAGYGNRRCWPLAERMRLT